MRYPITTFSLLLFVVALFAAGHVRATSDFRLVSGLVTANADEIANCQFAVAQETMVSFEPKSVPCDRMKTLIGRKVDLWFTVVE